MTTDAVILAAGYSSRANGFKMQFLMEAKAVIQHVIEAFLPICHKVIVVGGFQYELLLPLLEPYGAKVTLVVNDNFEKGMFSSVKVGVSNVTAEQFFITPGDYPLISYDICRQILETKKAYTIPSFKKKGGHPILLPSSCIKELLAEEEEGNLKSFLKKKEVFYLDMDEDGILYDLDTPEDYKRLTGMMKDRIEGGALMKEMEEEDIGILNGRVYLEGSFQKVNLYIKDEKISAITTEKLNCKEEVDAKGCMVLPGFIDPHVHFHLGVGERVSSDDFYTGSQKAALGGITTYIDFLDPVKRADQIEEAFEKRLQLAKTSVTDYAFHATIANPTDPPADIIKACKAAGITSIKLFTTYSNTDRRTKDKYIYDLLKASKAEQIKVVIHAESDELIDTGNDILVKDHETARPVLSERVEVMKLAEMARETGGNLYIVHVSAGSTVERLARDYSEELNTQQIIVESCPHYFLFNSNVYEQEEGYRYTMTPPLRPEAERLLLNEYIDYIFTIGTDHCPFEERFKKQKYTSDISMGIGGISYSFCLMYTLFQDRIIDKFTKAPAMAYGLYPNKGTLLPGADADIVIFDEKAQTKAQDKDSVYDGKTLQGAIKKVYLRGHLLVSENQVQTLEEYKIEELKEDENQESIEKESQVLHEKKANRTQPESKNDAEENVRKHRVSKYLWRG